MIVHKKLANGFEYIEIKNSAAEAKIALQGAHIFHYKRADEEQILWLSEVSDFEYGKAIRGGVPICWPWFGFNENKNLPQHGFARVSMWEFIKSDESDEKSSSLIFRLTHGSQTLKMWRYKFELELHVTISDKLTMELKTTNLDCESFVLTQALHTYFKVSHISHALIKGLDKKPYLDALTWKNEIQEGDITFNQEVDRVYQEVTDEIILRDENREIHIKNSGSSSTVVWNPWIEKTLRMSAMNENAYEHMLCIESANAFDDRKVLKPQSSYTIKAVIF
ncbi:MAG: D-hexose-6-phosphate mutarotase [Sulfurimonas sp. RIFOXYB2_FULL_37_5]|uniref:D-hexose-6-phosphate mutarotase n=1 Tax=Sulfurimonas sp. RIFOXYB12_FULL_35_9 TaxID=1802256 RepID=UPI0008B44D95|nr:D-hexose-6-phosphate mutarotase [Sulfurimonas sp. RIFOXYB12_FULL_35_9]MBS4068748.1 D-hexose-6-phosphate mutarotase [Sulfurimonas sp.]OHE03296.1 MAG: D-hexose-6-phosphate mutarotase [Sulfurimonas sp. RIFOXYB12_FULL_35_9]OHE06643.1 MAG: D-hexose-6-phosphate mutarotase [Sulfurimonas sp. RIFOXYB2_FULL_37_5]